MKDLSVEKALLSITFTVANYFHHEISNLWDTRTKRVLLITKIMWKVGDNWNIILNYRKI